MYIDLGFYTLDHAAVCVRAARGEDRLNAASQSLLRSSLGARVASMNPEQLIQITAW